VLVDDGGLIVLGGLIEDRHSDDENKVPLLGDLPILGGLFRYQSRTHTKTNLMIFLRPTIIRSPTDYQRLANLQYDLMETAQQRYHAQHLKSRPASSPLLPLPSNQLKTQKPLTPSPQSGEPVKPAPIVTLPLIVPSTPVPNTNTDNSVSPSSAATTAAQNR